MLLITPNYNVPKDERCWELDYSIFTTNVLFTSAFSSVFHVDGRFLRSSWLILIAFIMAMIVSQAGGLKLCKRCESSEMAALRDYYETTGFGRSGKSTGCPGATQSPLPLNKLHSHIYLIARLWLQQTRSTCI